MTRVIPRTPIGAVLPRDRARTTVRIPRRPARSRLLGMTVASVACAVARGAVAVAAEVPTPEMLQVLEPQAEGPRITPFLAYQLDRAWALRRGAAGALRAGRDRGRPARPAGRAAARRPSRVIGGLPETKTPLNARVTGTIPMDGYRIEKLVFESLPGIHVTALVYVPDGPAGKKPAVLLACGHSPVGKAHPAYQEIAVRLARRGYVVLCWDPVGQGERSQFWDAARGRSRYNLVCGEHAVLGNFATIAGTSLVRYMVWDGMRAVDYLLTRDDVDGARLADHRHERRRLPGPLDRRPRPADRASSCRPASRPRCPCGWPTASSRTPTATPSRTRRASSPRGSTTRACCSSPTPARSTSPRPSSTSSRSRARARRCGRSRPSTARFGHGDRIALSEGYHKHQYSAENQAKAFAFLDRAFGRPASRGPRRRRRRSRPRRCGARRAARCARTWAGAR